MTIVCNDTTVCTTVQQPSCEMVSDITLLHRYMITPNLHAVIGAPLDMLQHGNYISQVYVQLTSCNRACALCPKFCVPNIALVSQARHFYPSVSEGEKESGHSGQDFVTAASICTALVK